MDSLRYLTAGCWLENLGSSQHLSSSHRLDCIHYMAFSGQCFERMSESYKMSWHLDSVIDTSLLLHSVGQGKFSVQPRLKGWRNRPPFEGRAVISLPMDVHTGKRWLYCGHLNTQTMILRKREESGGESIGVCAESYISDSQTTRYIRITHFFFFFIYFY